MSSTQTDIQQPVSKNYPRLVADIGGPLSHAAIVAREYGIPAVLGTGDATSRIKDGEKIMVDGRKGSVVGVG